MGSFVAEGGALIRHFRVEDDAGNIRRAAEYELLITSNKVGSDQMPSRAQKSRYFKIEGRTDIDQVHGEPGVYRVRGGDRIVREVQD